MRAGVVVFAVSMFVAAPAWAGPAPAHFCADAAKGMKGDADLANAAVAAFGQRGFKDETPCIYPVQILRYAGADVLISQDGTPGDACHGCADKLSASVLKRGSDGVKLVRTYAAFGETGTFGATGKISAVAIRGDDGIAIQNDSMFQGCTASTLDLYAFRPRGLLSLTGEKPIPLAGDNSDFGGADAVAAKAISIESTWAIQGDQLTIDYVVSKGAKKRKQRAVWTIGADSITPKSGTVPKEMGVATGQE